MSNLISLEVRKWWRNGYIMTLLLGLSILGYISVLSSYFLADIIRMSSSEGISVDVPDPTSSSVFHSYITNFSQIGLVFCIFIFAKAVGVGADRSTLVYYGVRSRWSYRIYFPKILTGLFWTFLSVIISYILIRYSIWSLFSEEGFSVLLPVLLNVLMGAIFCVSLTSAIGVWTNNFLLSVAIPILAVYISSFISSFGSGETSWFPSSLLVPTTTLDSDVSLSDNAELIFLAGISSVILVIASGLRPLRRKIGPQRQSDRSITK